MLFAATLALLAGLSIPVGASISSNERLQQLCVRNQLDSFVAAFGGGALLAAIALVLVPHGIESTDVRGASLSFLAGGVVFWQVSGLVQRVAGRASQFLAVLLDFTPEALVLGASSATGSGTGMLLAMLIALQNMPEGFAAHREMTASGFPRRRMWILFALAPFLGPVAAAIGHRALSTSPEIVAWIMLFSSGAILYLVFQDIAPEARLEGRRFPALGAVLGFLAGMIGSMVVHA